MHFDYHSLYKADLLSQQNLIRVDYAEADITRRLRAFEMAKQVARLKTFSTPKGAGLSPPPIATGLEDFKREIEITVVAKTKAIVDLVATLPGRKGSWGAGFAPSTAVLPSTEQKDAEDKSSLEIDGIPKYIEQVMKDEKEHYPVRISVEGKNIILSVSKDEKPKNYVDKFLQKLGLSAKRDEETTKRYHPKQDQEDRLTKYLFVVDKKGLFEALSQRKECELQSPQKLMPFKANSLR